MLLHIKLSATVNAHTWWWQIQSLSVLKTFVTDWSHSSINPEESMNLNIPEVFYSPELAVRRVDAGNIWSFNLFEYSASIPKGLYLLQAGDSDGYGWSQGYLEV